MYFFKLYINSSPNETETRQADLDNALRYYGAVYDRDPTHYWHGINLVALRQHAARISGKKQTPKNRNDTKKLAQEVFKTAEREYGRLKSEGNEGAALWPAATAMEAAVAMGRVATAKRYLDRYLNIVSPTRPGARSDTTGNGHENTHRFALNSTLRQMMELYRLHEDKKFGFIVGELRSALGWEGEKVVLSQIPYESTGKPVAYDLSYMPV